MVTLSYENEDAAALPSFERRGEFCLYQFSAAESEVGILL